MGVDVTKKAISAEPDSTCMVLVLRHHVSRLDVVCSSSGKGFGRDMACGQRSCRSVALMILWCGVMLYNRSNQFVTPSPTVNFEIGENDTASYWIADLTSTYEGVSIVRRGLRLMSGRIATLVQDEMVGAAAGSQWKMHTTAKATLSEDKKIAGMFLIRTIHSPA